MTKSVSEVTVMLFIPFFLSLLNRHGVIQGVTFLCVLCWDFNQLKIYRLSDSRFALWKTDNISDISYKFDKFRGLFEPQPVSKFFLPFSAPWSWILFHHISFIQEKFVFDCIAVGIADHSIYILPFNSHSPFWLSQRVNTMTKSRKNPVSHSAGLHQAHLLFLSLSYIWWHALVPILPCLPGEHPSIYLIRRCPLVANTSLLSCFTLSRCWLLFLQHSQLFSCLRFCFVEFSVLFWFSFRSHPFLCWKKGSLILSLWDISWVRQRAQVSALFSTTDFYIGQPEFIQEGFLPQS